MSIEIQVRRDHKRGCGWRKPGGKYLIGGALCQPCGKLPHFLEPCPTCGATIKPIRGWRWIDADSLIGHGSCASNLQCDYLGCVLHDPPDRAGLIWIGDTFYTPGEFVAEASRLGISRRIKCVPKGFELGKTLVLLAARHVARLRDRGAELMTYEPGIFAAFVPTALEYVVRGDETPEELERLVRQGFTPVRIERMPEGGGDNVSGSQSARPGHEVPGPADLRPPGHGPEDDGPGGGGDMPGWIV